MLYLIRRPGDNDDIVAPFHRIVDPRNTRSDS